MDEYCRAIGFGNWLLYEKLSDEEFLDGKLFKSKSIFALGSLLIFLK